MKKVVILGAGLSGLGCARALKGARVFEASDHPGGHAYSHRVDGVSFDEGAHICHSKDEAWLRLISDQAGEVNHIARSRVTNYWHGHWVTYPVQNHLHDLPADVRAAALADFLRTQEEHRGMEPANYLEWCRFQYGDYLTRNFYAEYTRKYWRVPMEDLATDWLAGRLLPSDVERVKRGAVAAEEEQQPAFARFHYPARGGFFAFLEPLYRGIDVTYNARAVRVDPSRREIHFSDGSRETYEVLASSISLPELVGMIRGAPAAVSRAAADLRHVQLLCVNVILGRPALTPAHWFYIYDDDVDVARVSVISNLAPASLPAGRTALQLEIFRRTDEDMNAERLAEKAVADVGRILGFDPGADVLAVATVRVPYAYVISDHRRASAVRVITEWLTKQGIFTMGLFGHWKFIWSDAAFRSGEEAARLISAA